MNLILRWGLETLDFKFLLKPKYGNAPCVVEEGPNRLLTRGTLQGDTRPALFRVIGDEILEYRVFIKADRVSPFDLAASWRAYQENFQPSTVRGIPDVSINSAPEMGAEVRIRILVLRMIYDFGLPFLKQFFFCLSIQVIANCDHHD